MSRHHWMKYISGVRKEVIFTKSGGTFDVKRYLQGKSTIYRRNGKSDGDQYF